MHKIEREHEQYIANKAMWKKYRDLYVGGERFRTAAGEYLVRRNREPLEVYAERLDRVFYENYIGSIIDWYAATLMRREPVLTVEGNNDQGRTFFDQFVRDCDRKGTSLAEFFRGRLVSTLILGRYGGCERGDHWGGDGRRHQHLRQQRQPCDLEHQRVLRTVRHSVTRHLPRCGSDGVQFGKTDAARGGVCCRLAC